MREIIDTILYIPSAPFTLITLWGLLFKLSIILDALKNQQEGSSTDESSVLYQVVPSLPLGQTDAKEVSHEVVSSKGTILLVA